MAISIGKSILQTAALSLVIMTSTMGDANAWHRNGYHRHYGYHHYYHPAYHPYHRYHHRYHRYHRHW